MIIFFLSISFSTVLVSGSSLSDQVNQTPAEIYKKPGETAEISCSHSIQDYFQILWYKQTKNGEMQLLGYMNVNNGYPEKGVNVKIEGNANKGQTCTLTTEELSLNSSAVYFCAASYRGTSEAYFGGGTKLTVLERTPVAPKVEVFKPSKKECRNKKKTLVCLASDFYPDHVSVFWKIDGDNQTDGVATDNTALKKNDNYTITSRLRVDAEDWYTPGKNFTCIVTFFNGTYTEEISRSVSGVEAPAAGRTITRENYLRVTNAAKLSYGVFIAKSCIYGAFVAFLVWKLQGSTGKQNK